MKKELVNEKELWLQYKKFHDKYAFEKLLLSYLHIVKYQADNLELILPSFIDKDDLYSNGILGLIDAMKKFNISKNIRFITYASLRVRGTMLDCLRKQDLLPHSLRKKAKKIKNMKEKLQNELNRKPSLDELSEKLEMPKEKILEINNKINTFECVSIYAEINDTSILDSLESNEETPDEKIQNHEKEKIVINALNKLEERDKKIIYLIYYQELNQAEVAKILGLSAARVSQLHKNIVKKIKKQIRKKI
ncbi:MAG: sigma-70 family RNA polymerase sigma factor [archaeon]